MSSKYHIFDFVKNKDGFIVEIVLNEIKNNLNTFKENLDNLDTWYHDFYMQCLEKEEAYFNKKYFSVYEEEYYVIPYDAKDKNIHYNKLINYIQKNKLFFVLRKYINDVYLIISYNDKLIYIDQTLSYINIIPPEQFWNFLQQFNHLDFHINVPYLEKPVLKNDIEEKIKTLNWCDVIALDSHTLFHLSENLGLFKYITEPAKIMEYYPKIKTYRYRIVKMVIDLKVCNIDIDIAKIKKCTDKELYNYCLKLEIISSNYPYEEFIKPDIKTDTIDSLEYVLKIHNLSKKY